MRDYSEPTVDEYGSEVHPAWATIGAYRGQSTGTYLFDSDVKHQNTVTIRLYEANRKRDLHHDWIHGGKEIMEVELSEAQWASFVSAMNSGSGVPCTLRYTKEGGYTDDFPHVARLGETMAETHAAAQGAFDDIREAFAAYEALPNSPAKAKREALNTLRARIENAVPNVDYAGKVLIEHAEDVVQKSKADIEAFVVQKAAQLGLDPADIVEVQELRPTTIAALPTGPEEDEDD